MSGLVKGLILGICLLAWAAPGETAVVFNNGKWGTTFNCADYSQPSPTIDCDGLSVGAASPERGSTDGVPGTFPTSLTTVSTVANNESGLGGKGARFWQRYGSNEISGSLKILFATDQPELWIRWYQRYEAGYAPQFNSSWYHKQLYIQQTKSVVNTAVLPQWQGWNAYRLAVQGRVPFLPYNYLESDQISSGDGIANHGNFGWQSVMGGDVSDGKWHCYEAYIKMDSDATTGMNPPDPAHPGNGIGRMWIDGVLVAENSAVNFSAGDPLVQLGWDKILFQSNHSALLNTDREMYVDYDDIVVYNSTPPGRDAGNNPWIGPLPTSCAPAAPINLRRQ